MLKKYHVLWKVYHVLRNKLIYWILIENNFFKIWQLLLFNTHFLTSCYFINFHFIIIYSIRLLETKFASLYILKTHFWVIFVSTCFMLALSLIFYSNTILYTKIIPLKRSLQILQTLFLERNFCCKCCKNLQKFWFLENGPGGWYFKYYRNMGHLWGFKFPTFKINA